LVATLLALAFYGRVKLGVQLLDHVNVVAEMSG